MNGLDLFSGIGGISLALSPWVRTVAYCENDRYAQAVLLSRMSAGELEVAPIWDDVRTIMGEMLPPIDIIFGGFPCQDISVAGLGKGLGGERSGLFYEIVRLTKEINPTFVFLENVPAIRTRGLRQVVGAFTDLGYDCRWTRISAASIGAPFHGERWFLLAQANSKRLERWVRVSSTKKRIDNRKDKWNCLQMASSTSKRLERWEEPETIWEAFRRHRHSSASEWPQGLLKPSLPHGDDGLRFRVERIKSSGNAVVPPQAREAFMRLMGKPNGAKNEPKPDGEKR